MTKEQRKTAREWLYITAGILIMSAGIYFFKFPNHFSTGGVTGIAIVLGHYIPSVTPGTLVTIINVALLVLGFAVIGKSFGIRTVYASLLMSGTLQLLEVICPLDAPLTTQPLVELMFAVGLPAVGSAILFNLDASSGGTDILAMTRSGKKFYGNFYKCGDLTPHPHYLAWSPVTEGKTFHRPEDFGELVFE